MYKIKDNLTNLQEMSRFFNDYPQRFTQSQIAAPWLTPSA